MKKNISILFLTLFLNSLPLFSQNNKIDFLLNKYNKTTNEKEQINILKEISLSFLRIRDYENTKLNAQKGLDLSIKNNDKLNEIEFLEIFGECCYHNSQFNESLRYYKLIYKLSDDYNISEKKGIAFYGFSKVYWRKGMHNEAIYFETEAIKIFDKIGDTVNVNLAKTTLGTVFLDIAEYDKANDIYDELIKKYKNANDILGMANVYEKKGAVKFFQSYYAYARKYYYKAYYLYEKLGLDMEVAIELGNIAETYEMEGKYSKAITFYKQAINVEKEYKYYSGLIFLYQALGRSYLKTNKYIKAEESYNLSLEYINKIEEYRELINIYKLLHELYEKTKDYKKAYKYSLLTMNVKDSISGVEVQNQINEIRIKYETEKKENENTLLRNNQDLQEQVIEIQKKRNRKQYLVILVISLLFLVVVLFSILVLRFNKKNKRTGITLKNRNTQLNEVYSSIKMSISYAGKIQNAMLSSFESLKHNFSDYTIFYRPLTELSGDFYWSKRINDVIFIVVADSTGHGIPGALLSITGISFLNEIVNEDYIQTDTILNNLRNKIKKTLNQKGNYNETKDGWDMSIISYNIKTNELQFSGAYNSLYIISEQEGTKIISKYKADRQPVAVYIKEAPFTKQNIILKKGDIVWLFTDGFVDQFDNIGKKKYSIKRLKKLLLSISDEPMNKQNKLIEEEFENWKLNFDQVDDVLLTGFKI